MPNRTKKPPPWDWNPNKLEAPWNFLGRQLIALFPFWQADRLERNYAPYYGNAMRFNDIDTINGNVTFGTSGDFPGNTIRGNGEQALVVDIENTSSDWLKSAVDWDATPNGSPQPLTMVFRYQCHAFDAGRMFGYHDAFEIRNTNQDEFSNQLYGGGSLSADADLGVNLDGTWATGVAANWYSTVTADRISTATAMAEDNPQAPVYTTQGATRTDPGIGQPSYGYRTGASSGDFDGCFSLIWAVEGLLSREMTEKIVLDPYGIIRPRRQTFFTYGTAALPGGENIPASAHNYRQRRVT